MFHELLQAIEALRYLALLLQTGKLAEHDRDSFSNAILHDLEPIATEQPEASQ